MHPDKKCARYDDPGHSAARFDITEAAATLLDAMLGLGGRGRDEPGSHHEAAMGRATGTPELGNDLPDDGGRGQCDDWLTAPRVVAELATLAVSSAAAGCSYELEGDGSELGSTTVKLMPGLGVAADTAAADVGMHMDAGEGLRPWLVCESLWTLLLDDVLARRPRLGDGESGYHGNLGGMDGGGDGTGWAADPEADAETRAEARAELLVRGQWDKQEGLRRWRALRSGVRPVRRPAALLGRGCGVADLFDADSAVVASALPRPQQSAPSAWPADGSGGEEMSGAFFGLLRVVARGWTQSDKVRRRGRPVMTAYNVLTACKLKIWNQTGVAH
jgi:hypothetical protein